MITYHTGSIFDSDAEALVCPVNCVGVMGAGLAKEFRLRFPNNYRAYLHHCARIGMVPGEVYLVRQPDGPVSVYNVATKGDWRDPSRLRSVWWGLLDLARKVRHQSVAVPKLGCGLGGLQWSDVRPLAVHALESRPDVDWRVYE